MNENTSKAANASVKSPNWPFLLVKEFSDRFSQENSTFSFLMKGTKEIGTICRTFIENDGIFHVEASHRPGIEQLMNDAQKLMDTDFSLLNWQRCINLWSSFDAFALDFSARWLAENRNSLLAANALKGLRVDVNEYEQIDAGFRYKYLIDRILQDADYRRERGFYRYRKLLNRLGLDLEEDKIIYKRSIELHCYRNVYLHNSGRADTRFIEQCPWIDIALGETIPITAEHISIFARTVGWFLFKTLGSVLEFYGDTQSNVYMKNIESREQLKSGIEHLTIKQ